MSSGNDADATMSALLSNRKSERILSGIQREDIRIMLYGRQQAELNDMIVLARHAVRAV